ncbi:subunit of retromer complex [Haematococcus lacustris]
MVLILCIGDLHIPHRTPDLPQQFKELLKPGKIHSILCVGNLCSKSVLDYLRSIASDVTLVQGDFDEFTSPEYTVVTRGDFRIGLIHGHQVVPAGERASLSLLHRQLGVDILVTGHTHEHKVLKCEDGLQVMVGSATGAHSLLRPSEPTDKVNGAGGGTAPPPAQQQQQQQQQQPVPSFVLLDVDGPKATVYMYQLQAGKVKVDRIDYVKPPSPAARAS